MKKTYQEPATEIIEVARTEEVVCFGIAVVTGSGTLNYGGSGDASEGL